MSYPYGSPQNFMIRLPVLANELLDHISSYLPSKDQLSLTHTCWLLHDIAARLMYRQVTVTESTARRFFKTITESQEDYGKYVRHLRYFAAPDCDFYLTSFMFCAAIPRMNRLQHLALGVHHGTSHSLVHFLTANSLMATKLTCNGVRNYASNPIFVKALSELRTFDLHGDIELLNLVRYRNVTSIYITQAFDYADLTTFIDTVTQGTKNNYNIRSLTLTLQYTIGSRISLPMEILGNSFPKLESLVIRTPQANALEASHLLATTRIFPDLRIFDLNEVSIWQPLFILPYDEATKLQVAHAELAGIRREGLERLTFGTVKWLRDLMRNKWSMTLEVKRDDGDEALSEHNPETEYPVFWDVTYIKPRPVSVIGQVTY